MTMANLQHFTAAIVAGIVGGGVAYGVAANYKPKPTVIEPKTVIVSKATQPTTGGTMAREIPCPGATDGRKCMISVPVATPEMTRAEHRQAASSWGDLDQKEIDALTAALKPIAPVPLVIFCQDDAKCGDMALDFENAFESAHWKQVKQETPLIDDTFGMATSREDLRDAINEATSGRLAVKIIAKNAPYDVLVIGKKGGKGRS